MRAAAARWVNRALGGPHGRGARWVQPVAILLCVWPGAWLLVAAFTGQLGVNPAEALIRGLGLWALKFLCLTLAVTPLRQALGWVALARLRRTLGLATFGYALVHLLAYAWLDMGLYLDLIVTDVIDRPFITVGMLSVLLMLPLAATSFNRAIRALGVQRWQRLHRAVYVVAPLAILHFYWMRDGKNDYADVWLYGSVLAALLAWRLVVRLSGPGRPGHQGKPGNSVRLEGDAR